MDGEVLRERAIDSWTLALLRRVRGDELPVPAAVVFPVSTDEVAAVLAWASETRTAVIPRGAGSGVCGGAQAVPGAVVVDLSRMDRVTGVDLVSRVVHVQSGLRGDRLEDVLAGHGLTVGHYPQSIAMSTVGGWIAASPAGWEWLAFSFPEFGALADGLREVVREPTGAAVIRGYDEADAVLSFGSIGHTTGCVSILGFPSGLSGPGAPSALPDRKRLAAEVIRRAAPAQLIDPAYGDHWWEHRNDAAATYFQIMGPDRAFGPGVIVDTVEVAGLWSAVPELYAGVRTALAAHSQVVICHLSHLHPSGSSLYFTFLVSGADDGGAEERYLMAWEQAARACDAAGGTITHHHGVGRLKSGFLAGELGGTGVGLLRRLKAAIDPAGIMNPRVLLP